MENRIKMICDCGHIYPEVPRDDDAPENATSMGCNFFPVCEHTQNDYYDEWYNFDEVGESESNDPNQLLAFSIADDILNNHVPVKPLITEANPLNQ